MARMPTPEASGAAPRILIAGGGVAALEALIGLRDLLDGMLVKIDVVAPTEEFVYRPLSVAGPFGAGDSPRFSLTRIAADHGAGLHRGLVDSVDHEQTLVGLRDGRRFAYDALLLALGAQPCEWLLGAIPFTGPEDVGRLRALVLELTRGELDSIVFTAPAGLSWTLPLYELALLTAARMGELRLGDIRLTIVTPESLPLQVLGAHATRHVRELCANYGIALKTGVRAVSYRDRQLTLESGERIHADRVVAVPELRGEPIAGAPCDDDGFIPVDEHGAVSGLRGVYAAGDGTDYPIKHGGLAAQQADAAAEAIAAALGARVEPRAFDATLRGELLTGLEPAYITLGRSESGGSESTVAFDPLWRPAGKIAGRYLSPYLAQLPLASE
jgi:sulfide:quinone oxidoreductase